MRWWPRWRHPREIPSCEYVIDPYPSPVSTVSQVVVDYVAMTTDLRVFESTLEKGKPSDIRVTSGGEDGPASVIKGMNEGLQTMQPGGVRRLYIPGELAFVKGLGSAPGRPRVPPLSPVVFDVKLVYIPGARGWTRGQNPARRAPRAADAPFARMRAPFSPPGRK